MKRSLDNQINAFLIDILRIKWLVICYGRLSSAQLDRWQAPKQRDTWQRSKERVLDKGIRQKSTKE